MKNFNYISCPACGKQLINLNEGDPTIAEDEFFFWCDECNLDIAITVNGEEE